MKQEEIQHERSQEGLCYSKVKVRPPKWQRTAACLDGSGFRDLQGSFMQPRPPATDVDEICRQVRTGYLGLQFHVGGSIYLCGCTMDSCPDDNSNVSPPKSSSVRLAMFVEYGSNRIQ